MKEYATTFGTFQCGRQGPSGVEDPSPPEGDGWAMCGSACEPSAGGYGVLFWFWVRDEGGDRGGDRGLREEGCGVVARAPQEGTRMKATIKTKATVRITRYTANQPPYSGITVTIIDADSGAQVEAKMSLEEFAGCVTGVSTDRIPAEWFRMDVVGKKKEHKVEVVKFTHTGNKTRDMPKARAALKEYERDGWIGDVENLFNPHKVSLVEGGGYYHVNFHRWVTP